MPDLPEKRKRTFLYEIQAENTGTVIFPNEISAY